MSFYDAQGRISLLAGEDLSGKEGCAVQIGTAVANSCVLADDGTKFLGVILYAGRAYNAADAVAVRTQMRNVTVATCGTVRAIAGGTITAGSPVTVTTDGKFIAATATATVVGHALTDGAEGKSFSLRLNGRSAVVPS